MMKAVCNTLIDEYLRWLREQIAVSELDGACEITTPFLDRHNDYLQIYVIPDGEQYILTDDGYILSDLRMSGVDLNTEKRQRVLRTMLRGFGVEDVDGRLQVKASTKNLAQKKHALLQAMLAVNDLFLVAQSRVASFFVEDVEQFLQLHDIRFITNVSFTGRSGYTHHFDFAIPSSKYAPDRFVKAINSPTRDSILSCIFAWTDTREARRSDAQSIAFLNDENKKVSQDSIDALSSYDILPVLWSRRDESVEILAA